MGNVDGVPDGGGDAAEAAMRRLIDEFGAMLDESLIRAIASDHDDVLGDGDAIRGKLAPLAEMARVEEYTGFDPSGLGTGDPTDAGALRFGEEDEEAATSGVDTMPSSPPTASVRTEGTTTTSETSDYSDVPFTSQSDIPEEDKIDSLLTIFPNFREHTVRFVLKEARGDLEHAFDALLSRQHLEESGELAKGVDGFYVSDDEAPFGANRDRAPSKGKQNRLHLSYDVILPGIDSLELEGDAGPVASPTRRCAPMSPPPPLSPSLPAAARSRRSQSVSVSAPNALAPVLRVTAGSLAKAPQKSGSAEWQVVSRKRAAGKENLARTPLIEEREHTSARAMAAALHRKGPLYRQAASVYAERAREEFRAGQAKSALAAEQLVDQTSTPLKIDLHGVAVMDGVRIAKRRVQRWWDSLGEDRARRAALQGFTVVTGVGYHSAHGVSRLRQAVGAALKNDGWRVTTLTGEFYVTGKV